MNKDRGLGGKLDVNYCSLQEPMDIMIWFLDQQVWSSRNVMGAPAFNFTFSSNHINKARKGEINFNNI